MYFVSLVENGTLVEVLDYHLGANKTSITMTVINPASKRKLVLANAAYHCLTPEEKDQSTWREMTEQDVAWAEKYYYPKIIDSTKEIF